MDASLRSLASHVPSCLSFAWLHMLFCALDCQWNVCNAVRKRSSVWLSVCVWGVGLPGTVDSGRPQLQTSARSQASVSALRDIVIPTRPQQSSVYVVMGLTAVNIFARILRNYSVRSARREQDVSHTSQTREVVHHGSATRIKTHCVPQWCRAKWRL